MFGASLAAAKSAESSSVALSNDYLTAEFTTAGGMLSKVTLHDYTKYAPKGERNEKVVLFDPSSAKFDLEFYLKRDRKNVKINTEEYVFTNAGVSRGDGFQTLAMRLDVGEDAYLLYEYVVYDEKDPSRDYMIDLNVKMVNMAPLMAAQSTLGLDWSNRTYRNERGFKNENMYTTLSYRLPDEASIEDLGMGDGEKEESVKSEINWIAFKQQFFSEALIAHGNFAYADMSLLDGARKFGIHQDLLGARGSALRRADHGLRLFDLLRPQQVRSVVEDHRPRGREDRDGATHPAGRLAGGLDQPLDRYPRVRFPA